MSWQALTVQFSSKGFLLLILIFSNGESVTFNSPKIQLGFSSYVTALLCVFIQQSTKLCVSSYLSTSKTLYFNPSSQMLHVLRNLHGLGHCSIVDKSSAYSAKGPGFTTRWRQEFININCMFSSFEKIKLQLGPTLKKIIIIIYMEGGTHNFCVFWFKMDRFWSSIWNFLAFLHKPLILDTYAFVAHNFFLLNHQTICLLVLSNIEFEPGREVAKRSKI